MDISNSCKSLWITSFLPSKILDISKNIWPRCSSEEAHVAQIVMSHCVQKSTLMLAECFGHAVVDPRFLNNTTLCSFDSSERCSPTQALHRCT